MRPTKKLFSNNRNLNGRCHFFQAQSVFLEELFLGAFCHKGKLIFLKSTKKDGHFDT
jgi:hypothetical protein